VWGRQPRLSSASLPMAPSPLQDKSRAPRKAGAYGPQPPPGKRFVARGSEPSARQAESSGKRGCGGCSSRLPSVSLLAVASRLKDKSLAQWKAGLWGRQPPPAKCFVARGSEPSARQAERSGKRGGGGGSPHLLRVVLSAVTSRLQDRPSAAESGGVEAAAPTCRALRCPR
jgi:hypothetical protein